MHGEEDFLRKLLENPADDTARLVYADWLDERADAESQMKAQFLRVTVRLMGPIRRVGWRKPRQYELQRLAAQLPTDWLAVVSRLKVEGCRAKAQEHVAPNSAGHTLIHNLFEFVCDKRWDEMTPTADQSVRRCEQCQENVHYCDTLAVARQHAEKNHCIAVDLGVIRRHDDLSPPQMWAGRPSAGTLRQEAERQQLDAVSLEREKRKHGSSAGDEPV